MVLRTPHSGAEHAIAPVAPAGVAHILEEALLLRFHYDPSAAVFDIVLDYPLPPPDTRQFLRLTFFGVSDFDRSDGQRDYVEAHAASYASIDPGPAHVLQRIRLSTQSSVLLSFDGRLGTVSFRLQSEAGEIRSASFRGDGARTQYTDQATGAPIKLADPFLGIPFPSP